MINIHSYLHDNINKHINSYKAFLSNIKNHLDRLKILLILILENTI